MTIDPSTLVERVCNLPIDFAMGDISLIQLVRQSGYLEAPDLLASPTLQAHLRSNPELLHAWLQLSADNRSSPAWYFVSAHESPRHKHSSGYVVGFSEGGEQLFDDPVDACANYILHKLEGFLRYR